MFANLYLLLTYLLLSAVPFVPMLMGKPLARPWQVLGVEFVAWAAAWAIFRRPARFHWLLIPAFLALPTEVYLYTYYGQGISTHHLGIIAETSPKEAMEFLGSTVWLMLAVMVGMLVWWVTTFKAARRTRDLDWSDGSRWVMVAMLACGAAVWAYGYEFGVEGRRPAAAASASIAGDDKPVAGAGHTGLAWPALPRRAMLPVEFDAFANSWPFGLVSRSYDFTRSASSWRPSASATPTLLSMRARRPTMASQRSSSWSSASPRVRTAGA